MNVSDFPGIRQGSMPFRDDVNFPRGISRSGTFSVSQSELLRLFGETLKKLEIGTLPPANEAEDNFVRFCDGKREAESQLEKLWLKYKQEICRKRSFHTAFGGCQKEDGASEYEIDEEFLEEDSV